MTRPTGKRLAAAVFAIALGAPALATPAHAGGSIALYLSPQGAEQAQLMDLGLRGYALYNGMKGSGGRIEQRGRNNSAGIAQAGRDNVGIVSQRGDGHAATLQQRGEANSYGIFQFGRGSRADVRQAGNGNTGATFTFGW